MFDQLFSAPAGLAATSDAALLRAMLDAEAALALAQAELGLVPAEAADAIAVACAKLAPDPEQIGRDARAAGNPAVPLVRALTAAAPAAHAGWVHWGATSQDIIDTALVLVCRRAAEPLLADAGAAGAAARTLAVTHRDTLMGARTLLQQALPTTFGLKAAGWMLAVDHGGEQLRAVVGALPAQLGGAAGTLAAMGPAGPAVLARFAARLELPEPVLPWHTSRAPIAELAAGLAVLTGAAGKVALDVTLLMQTEVGEVAEPAAPGRGGSSTLPHKRNPVLSALVTAAADQAPALAATLLAGLPQEHERAAGAWHAEWQPLIGLIRLTGGAMSHLREILSGLEVFPERMRANLAATGGLALTEHVMMALAEQVGRERAHELVGSLARTAAANGTALRAALQADPQVRAHLDPAALDAALDPANYLGAAGALLDRAVRHHDTPGTSPERQG